MAYPEKTKRNEKIYYLHLSGLSYRAIRDKVKIKSEKNVYRIVERMRGRYKDARAFLQTYQEAHPGRAR
jgi:Mor family transcriptional regulator